MLHDVELERSVDVGLFLRCALAALPALFLVEVTSSSTSSTAAVHVVIGQTGLDELGGGVRRRLTSGSNETAVFQIGAVEGLHLVDLVGEVHVAVESRVRSQQVAGFVVHLVAVVGDAVGWTIQDGEDILRILYACFIGSNDTISR